MFILYVLFKCLFARRREESSKFVLSCSIKKDDVLLELSVCFDQVFLQSMLVIYPYNYASYFVLKKCSGLGNEQYFVSVSITTRMVVFFTADMLAMCLRVN